MSKDLTSNEIDKRMQQYGMRISQWSPGDGWTRHKVTDKDGGREHSQNMTLAELRAWFRGFLFAKTGERW